MRQHETECVCVGGGVGDTTRKETELIPCLTSPVAGFSIYAVGRKR